MARMDPTVEDHCQPRRRRGPPFWLSHVVQVWYILGRSVLWPAWNLLVSPPASHGYVNLELSVNELEFASSVWFLSFSAQRLLIPTDGSNRTPNDAIHGRDFRPGQWHARLATVSVLLQRSSPPLVACHRLRETAGVRVCKLLIMPHHRGALFSLLAGV